MKLALYSEVSGDQPVKERKWFVDKHLVSWDFCSPLPMDLVAIIKAARQNAEKEVGGAVRLHQISLTKVGSLDEDRAYFYWVYFHAADDQKNGVSLAIDLFGNIIEPEVRFFEDNEAYSRYAYSSLHADD